MNASLVCTQANEQVDNCVKLPTLHVHVHDTIFTIINLDLIIQVQLIDHILTLEKLYASRAFC